MKFTTAAAFRTSLETRLNARARAEQRDINRLRTQVAFERFLERLFQTQPDWVLKGGYALEVRLHDRARSTVDLDLNATQPADLLVSLQLAAQHPVPDHFEFTVRAQGRLNGPPAGGQRFHVEARLAGRPFAWFHVDLGLGDIVTGDPEWLNGQVDLSFAGLPPTRLRIYPLVTHFAEKVHAYTRPREQPTRVKDLLDLALLLNLGLTPQQDVLDALLATFQRYGTHPLPRDWPEASSGWHAPFQELARATGLASAELSDWQQQLNAFWEALPWPAG